MLFDVAPKEVRSDLYDRGKELEGVFEGLKLEERLIVIYGVRMIGKSSLVKVAMNEALIPHVFIDVREIYYREGVVTASYLIRYLINGFRKHMRLYEKAGFQLREALKKIKSIHVKGYEIEIEPSSKITLSSLLSEINSWCNKHNIRFTLVFDEAQYLRFSNVRYDMLFAWCIDNLSNITLILTGSEIGVLRDFLKINDPKAPLYGRYRREIYVERFSKEQSIDFLIRGFKELNMKPNIEEIEEAVEIFDGVVGWLTHYGYYRGIRKISHRNALTKVFEEGSKLILNEMERLIAPSKRRYTAILKAVAQGMSSWSDIKAYVIGKTGYITNKRFTTLLNNLVKYGYLTKENNNYKIPDPITKETCKHLNN